MKVLLNLSDVRAHPYAPIALHGLTDEQKEDALRLAMWFVDCPTAAFAAVAEARYSAVIGPAASLASRMRS